MVFLSKSVVKEQHQKLVVKELLQKPTKEARKKEEKNPTLYWLCGFFTERASNIKESTSERYLIFLHLLFPCKNDDVMRWGGYATACWLCIDLNHDYFQPSQHFDNRDGSSLSDGVIFLSESSQVHKQSLLPSCQQLQPNIHTGWGSVSRRQYFQHPCLSSMVRFGDWSSYSGENWPNIFDINFLTQNIRS